MIKKNTQKLLLSLYRPTESLVMDKRYLELIVPELSPSGLRSLLHQLQQQSLLSVFQGGASPQWSLTKQGHQVVEGLFPAFLPKSDGWSVLVFLTAPKTDPAFRYLRRYLLEEGWLSLSRGNYLWQGAVSEEVRRECLLSYPSSVLIFEVKEWTLGDFNNFILRQNNITELIKNYSGISREIATLTGRGVSLDTMNDQQKNQLSSLFNRLYENIRVDYGFTGPWLTNISRPLFILRDFQSLIRSI